MLLLLAAGCGKDTVVLLPNLDGSVGAVTVTPREGEPVELSTARQAVEVSSKTTARPTFTMSRERLDKEFGEALAAQPRPPVKFMLHFDSDSTRLKPDSETLLPEIIAAVRKRGSTDISVIGHSDRAGNKEYNMELSHRRAASVAKKLQEMGLDEQNMELNSHGENNPIVPTEDGVHKAVNRRVEVTIR